MSARREFSALAELLRETSIFIDSLGGADYRVGKLVGGRRT